MAIINCIECNSKISDKAKSCPNCGCPLQEIKKEGFVKIKFPQVDPSLWAQSKKCIIQDSDTDEIYWEGRMGQVAEFYIDCEKEVTILVGTFLSNPLYCKIKPNKKYSITQDMGMHWNATYNISQIEIIDSD